MTHSWCRDVQRDEAVRAAENGRSGPLPTLAEAISRAGQFAPSEAPQPPKCTERESVTDRRPFNAGGGENVTGFAEAAKRSPSLSETGEGQSGLRTERVTLEITYDNGMFGWSPPGTWAWPEMLKHRTESVRVVEEAHFDDLANVAMERDAAIRERDEAKAFWMGELRSRTAERDAARDRVAELDEQLESVACRAATAENRVAELESAAKLASPANAAAESNHAPAASGAAGTGAAG